MGEPKSFVVSGIGKRNALLRLLREECARHGLRLVGCDADAMPPAIVAVDRFRQVPRCDHPDFPSAYREVLQEERAVACITLIDPEIPVLGQLADELLTRGVRVLHPARSSALLCEDKMAFFEAMDRADIPAVATQLTPLHELPFIRKHRRGSAASGFHVFRDADDPLLGTGSDDPAEYVYQPFCAGQHVCIDAYFSDDGTLIDLCAKEVLNKANGESYLLRSTGADRFVELVDAVADAVPLRGIVNLDVYEDGDLRVMEVNCRIGGNYPASHAFGCNLLRRLVDSAVSGETSRQLDVSEVRVDEYVAKYFEFSTSFAHPDGATAQSAPPRRSG